MDVEARRAKETGAVLTFAGFVVGIVGINLITSCRLGYARECQGPAYESTLGFLLAFAGACAALLGIVYLLSLPPRTLPDAPDAVFRAAEERLPDEALFWGRVLWIAILSAALVVVEAIPIYYLYNATAGTSTFDLNVLLATLIAFGLGDVTFIAFMVVTFDQG
ncbi:MAG TPA: hypothetical protein HA326_02505 [Thermoplasmata archaeon]|nr:hypothetical protein [Thermoplasmata archaeon]